MIRIGIVGYGNLGRGVEAAVRYCEDMALVAVFTRRNPASVTVQSENLPVVAYSEMTAWKDRIDVMILCGGSATDLPWMTAELAEYFHVVDSFDTHAKIPEHFAKVDAVAQRAKTLAVISAGWDPGLFSLNRLYAGAILPQGKDYTFWGKGVSQGHSDAIRRIAGVVDARQYTVPIPAALARVKAGENPEFTTREKHTRECYVVVEEGADKVAIEHAIVTMPNYFDEYITTVTFISMEELQANHSGLPHGGTVIRSGVTGLQGENQQTIEYTLTLDSNPQFTSSVLVACARAAYKLAEAGQVGCKTMFDIPPAALSPRSAEDLRASLL